MVDDNLLPKFILARVLGQSRQQIGSGLKWYRKCAPRGQKRAPESSVARGTHPGAQAGHFEGTSANLDQKLTEKEICLSLIHISEPTRPD